ncbi:MAG TPA: ChaN family lipoprotein [Vicinamibacterales bacterium]|nr:ChaN family lipoprotein [Vicinamibacterales bacterium]
MLTYAVLLAATLSAQNIPPTPVPGHGASLQSYVPQRVYDTQKKAFVDFEVMLAALTTADVVLVGEQHDDPNTHRLEAALLDGLMRRKVSPIVSLEMFERDVQPAIDAYLAGRVPEEEMLKNARPWPRYATDYRGLVERARAHGWPVIAANVPRRIAQDVAKNGREAIAKLPDADRAHVAGELECPLDAYYERFAKTMGSHPGSTQTEEEQRATMERYYWSQCVKDETMAESIAAAVQRAGPALGEQSGARGPVVHYNGAFHSDFRLGTAERVVRRLPGKRVVVITMVPVEDLDALAPSEQDHERADYLVYTIR